VQQANQLSREKTSLQHLIKEGAIGEDVWNRIQRADEELSMELQDVIQEAETFKEGWGSEIMQEASRRLQQHAHQPPTQPVKTEKEKEMDMAQKQKLAEKAMKELLAQEEAEKKRKKPAPLKKKK